MNNRLLKLVDNAARLTTTLYDSCLPVDPVVIPCEMGIGDLIAYLPAIRGIGALHDTTLLCTNPSKAKMLRDNTGLKVLDTREIPSWTKTVVCNHLAQWTPIIRDIVLKKVPCRIGHALERRSWVWNYPIPFDPTKRYDENNNGLLAPFNGVPLPPRLKYDGTAPKYDVVLAPFSSDSSRDWAGFKELEERLKKRCKAISIGVHSGISLDRAFALVDRCKVFVGNDSGLGHARESFQKQGIRIFMREEHRGLARSRYQVDLLRPNVNDVDKIVELML